MKPINYKVLILFFFTFLIQSCMQQIAITGYWYNKESAAGKNYQKAYFVSLLNDVIKNATVETDLSAEAKKRSMATAMNQEHLAAGFVNKDIGKEAILAKARELECDLIFTIAIADVKSENYYVPGQVNYSPGSSYGYYNSFPGYYDRSYSTYQTPGYYVNDKTYFIETNVYDVKDLKLLWSLQSQAYNPSNLKTVSALYAKEVFKKMDAEGFTKRIKK
jgi:hypothetical protein